MYQFATKYRYSLLSDIFMPKVTGSFIVQFIVKEEEECKTDHWVMRVGGRGTVGISTNKCVKYSYICIVSYNKTN